MSYLLKSRPLSHAASFRLLFPPIFALLTSSLLISCSDTSENSNSLANAHPPCSPAAVDPDGDGWGWENDKKVSCRMGSSAPEAQGPQEAQGPKNSQCNYVPGTCSPGGTCGIYGDDGSRASIKSTIWNTMFELNKQKLGEEIASCRADIAVAIAMQEAHSFKLSGGNIPYDYKKDSRKDGAQNVSIFNINIDFIKLSCVSDCGKFQDFANNEEKKYLNRLESLPETVKRLSEGFDHFGVDAALHFHRGGRGGWQNPTKDEHAYANAQKTTAHYLKQNPAARTNDQRVATSIPYR